MFLCAASPTTFDSGSHRLASPSCHTLVDGWPGVVLLEYYPQCHSVHSSCAGMDGLWPRVHTVHSSSKITYLLNIILQGVPIT